MNTSDYITLVAVAIHFFALGFLIHLYFRLEDTRVNLHVLNKKVDLLKNALDLSIVAVERQQEQIKSLTILYDEKVGD